MLSLNKLLSSVVKNTETVKDYLFWEHLEHKKIAESLGQIVKKYTGRNQILETKSTLNKKNELHPGTSLNGCF